MKLLEIGKCKQSKRGIGAAEHTPPHTVGKIFLEFYGNQSEFSIKIL